MSDERLYAKLTLDFVDSPKIAPLSDSAFRAYIETLLWSRRLLTDGFIPSRMIGRLITEDALEELLTNDPVNPSIQKVEGGYRIHDYEKHQVTNSDIEKKRASGKKGAAARYSSSSTMAPAIGDLSESQSDTMASKEKEKEKEEHIPGETRDDVLVLCQRLQERIIANGSRRPTVTEAWRTEARLLLDRDKRSLDEALRVLDWSQSDPFWRSNILSMPTFRKQFDKLRLASERETRSTTEQEAERAAEAARLDRDRRIEQARQLKEDMAAQRERAVPPPECEHGLTIVRCRKCQRALAEAASD
jgi:hypothetical protein